MVLMMGKRAFTLIELMVVVGIIVIGLIVLPSGSSPPTNPVEVARNAARQNDMLAVAKSMETCFNIENEVYWGEATDSAGNTFLTVGGGANRREIAGKLITRNPASATNTPFAAAANSCLDKDILPFNHGVIRNFFIDTHPYFVKIDACQPQNFIICAELENSSRVDDLANVQGGSITSGPDFTTLPEVPVTCEGGGLVENIDSIDLSTSPVGCDSNSDAKRCWFCIKNSQ